MFLFKMSNFKIKAHHSGLGSVDTWEKKPDSIEHSIIYAQKSKPNPINFARYNTIKTELGVIEKTTRDDL